MATVDTTGEVGRAIEGRPREDADHVFHELTRSICPSCRKVIDAKIVLSVSGCENPRKDGEELDRWAKTRRSSGWVRVI